VQYATKIFLAAALLTGVASTSISAAPQDVLASFDNVMDKKLVSADGATILITPSERQFTRQITLRNGTPQKTLFIFFTATNGAVANASAPRKMTGAFQITDQGIEIGYSDGTHEVMAVNSSGGVTSEFTLGTRHTCRFWLAEGHVFTREERRAALAQYAGRFGFALLSTNNGKPGCPEPRQPRATRFGPRR
jgi:hypothetical protein